MSVDGMDTEISGDQEHACLDRDSIWNLFHLNTKKYPKKLSGLNAQWTF